MKRLSIIAPLFICFLACAADSVPSPAEIRAHSGDAIGTAKLTHFDYRRHLDRAISKQSDGLHELFAFTTTEGFVGAGAEDHCAILHDLLQVWGDRRFAAVLRGESPRTRKAVVAALDYSWRYPGWQPAEFPQTYQLAAHKKIVVSPP